MDRHEEGWGPRSPRFLSRGGPHGLLGDFWPQPACGLCMAVRCQEVVLGSRALGLGRTWARMPGFGHAAFSREPSVVGGCEEKGEAMLGHGCHGRSPLQGPDGKPGSHGSAREGPCPGSSTPRSRCPPELLQHPPCTPPGKPICGVFIPCETQLILTLLPANHLQKRANPVQGVWGCFRFFQK